ncbi:MAG TPA: LuxR C-terminal-related transcriptional regulator [Burkholderiaceae bacterium]|jgi:two-component system response regulator DctR
MLHIVDQEKNVRDSISCLATSHAITVSTYASAEVFLTEINRTRGSDPQGECILLDIQTPIVSGIALFYALTLRDLMQRFPVILMTDRGNVSMAIDMLKQNAFGFFEKPFNHDVLIERIKKALATSRAERTVLSMQSGLAALSAREREVLDLILAGNMNKVIGEKLGISTRTVEVHRSHIFDKTQVRNAVELARIFK